MYLYIFVSIYLSKATYLSIYVFIYISRVIATRIDMWKRAKEILSGREGERIMERERK